MSISLLYFLMYISLILGFFLVHCHDFSKLLFSFFLVSFSPLYFPLFSIYYLYFPFTYDMMIPLRKSKKILKRRISCPIFTMNCFTIKPILTELPTPRPNAFSRPCRIMAPFLSASGADPDPAKQSTVKPMVYSGPAGSNDRCLCKSHVSWIKKDSVLSFLRARCPFLILFHRITHPVLLSPYRKIPFSLFRASPVFFHLRSHHKPAGLPLHPC